MTLRVHPDEIVRSSKSQLLATHDSWERVRLGDVADVLNGFAFKSTEFSHERGVPLLRIRDVGASTTQIRYAGDYDARYVVSPGTIVVGMDGDFRGARWTGPPALLNQRVCTITVRDPTLYDEAFLLFALPGYLDAIHDWTSSITVKHLSSETVKEIPLPLPPLTEQRRIVTALEEQISQLDGTHTLVGDVSRRLAILTEAVLGLAGNGPPVRLGDLVVDARYGTSTKCTYEGAGPPVLRIPNVRDRRVDVRDLKRAADPAADVPTVEAGDLLFIRTNGSRDLIGRVAVVDTESAGIGFASYLIRARPDPALVDPGFVALALSGRRLRSDIERRAASTAGQYNLNLRAISELASRSPHSPISGASASRLRASSSASNVSAQHLRA